MTLVKRLIEEGGLHTTTVNAFEVLGGARSVAARNAAEGLLGLLEVLPLDWDAACHAADVRRRLEGQGQAIGPADCLIAGVCLSRGAQILTRNRAHFERVPGLTLASFFADEVRESPAPAMRGRAQGRVPRPRGKARP